MDEKKPERPLPDESELMGLVELQKFLADELSEVDPDAEFSRSFLPLTPGLGLAKTPAEKAGPDRQARGRKEPRTFTETPERERREPVRFADPEEMPSIRDPEQMPRRWPPTETGEDGTDQETKGPESEEATTEALLEKLRRMPAPEERRARSTPKKVESKGLRKVIDQETPTVAPPPVPQVTVFRRLGAWLMDQFFVLGLFVVAVIITLQLVGPANSPLGLRELVRPVVLRLAVLEFSTIWLCYLSLCLGLLDMTFGMWIWGIRVAYPGEVNASRFLRKVMRIFCSFLFFAPILPSVLLAFRFRGRSLLDLLSGTRLYRSGI